ncbi:MAG: galactose mutarotase [Clostridiales bacterium]|nr:galactose mutarotase [Clostridiales bacterium]
MNIKSTSVMSPKGDITLFTIINAGGSSVTLSSLGAGIVGIVVPDSQGNMADVVLGYANPADYLADGPCAGKVPGRYANRIAKGHFMIDGNDYNLAINNGPNALHGGPQGFQNQLWSAEQKGDDTVVFTLESPDGYEGYPGNLVARAIYTWNDCNQLTLQLEAECDAKTVVNLTNHVYFNLQGHNQGSMTGHKLWLNASNFLPTDNTQIPTGEIAPVAGTPMDFTQPKAIGRHMYANYEPLVIGKGYDHCWVIDGYTPGLLQHVATLSDSKSGRSVEVETTQPGIQVYGGNWLEGCPAGKDGAVYHDYSAVALECQGFPDAPNKPQFPSQVLEPGQEYKHIIKFTFKA